MTHQQFKKKQNPQEYIVIIKDGQGLIEKEREEEKEGTLLYRTSADEFRKSLFCNPQVGSSMDAKTNG